MRVFRSCLAVALLFALGVPSAAQAAKLKTKIVFVNVPDEDDGDYYSSSWSLDATSVPNPVARARLLYYRPSSRKWLGYAKRPIAIERGPFADELVRIARATTDKRGYFSFTMKQADGYRASYAGSKNTNRALKWQHRYDWVETRTSTIATTASVDATRTRINIETDYRYNPFVPSTPGVDTSVFTVDWNLGEPDMRQIYYGWSADASEPRNGHGHASVSFVVPNSVFDRQFVGVKSEVSYFGVSEYICENESGEDPWFGIGLTPAGGATEP